MRRNRLAILLGAVLVLTISLGFLSLSDDDPTTAASYTTFRPVEPLQQGDYLGTWSAGANITSPGSNGGAGVGYSRNDTAWLFALNGDIDGSGTAPGTFRLYNVTTNTWSNLTNVPSGRAWTSMCKLGPVSNTKLYNLGGLPSGATAWSQMTGTFQCYTINTGTWATLTAAPTPTGSSGLIGYQDSIIYSVGGMGTSGSPITNVQVYNAISGTWRAGTSLPAARANGWVVIMNDTIYYGCGAGPTTSTFNTTVYAGVISQTNRANITWSTNSVSFPLGVHRIDADVFGCKGAIIGPGGSAWWGMGNGAYTWLGGSNPFVSVGPVPTTTSDAMTGSAFFQRGSYKVWKFVIASGLILSAPYHILNTQIYTDSCMSAGPSSGWCEGFNTTTFPPTGWTLEGTATTLWVYDPVSGFGNGTGSAKAYFYGVSTGSRQLITPTFTATGANDSLIFQNAYCTFTTENDQLQIKTSSNGGTNWTPLVTLNGGVSGELVTAPPQTAAFTPTSSQWKYQRIKLPTGTNKIQFNAITAYGNNLFIDSICVKSTLTGISNYVGTPSEFKLLQNYPNPFNPVTKIDYALPKAGFVKLVVFDILGREVATLVNDVKQAGIYSVDFNASSLSSGIYFYRLESNGLTDIKKMMLVK